MCVVLQHILARGPAARPRCIPPAFGALGVRPPFAPTKRIAVLSLASSGRCTTSQGSVPATPNNPMTKGTSLPYGTLDQPCADWMRAIASADGSRPAYRLLDFKQGFRPLHHDQGCVLGCILPWALPRPATTQLSRCFGLKPKKQAILVNMGKLCRCYNHRVLAFSITITKNSSNV